MKINKLKYYYQMLHWSIEQAIALSLGLDPEEVKLNWQYLNKRFKQEYEQRIELLSQAISCGKIASSSLGGVYSHDYRVTIAPMCFIELANQKGWTLPVDMEELVKQNYVDGKTKRKIPRTKEQTEKEKNCIKMIAHLLTKRSPNKAIKVSAEEILDAFSEQDVPYKQIKEDTTRDIFKKVRLLLGVKGNIKTKNITNKSYIKFIDGLLRLNYGSVALELPVEKFLKDFKDDNVKYKVCYEQIEKDAAEAILQECRLLSA